MGDTPNTDEQRLAEFTQKLDSFKPEGFDDGQYAALKEALIGFHKSEVQGLKINSAKMKEEKEALATKNKELESSLSTSSTAFKELQEKLAASQPDELRKHYENQQAQLSEVFSKKEHDYQVKIENLERANKELEQGVLERDVMAEFNKAAGTKNWLGGGRDLAEKFVCGIRGSNFKRLDMGDGTTLLVNEAKQDMTQAIDKFCETEVGKSLLVSSLSGGGAEGSATRTGTGKMSEAQYKSLSPQDQMDAVLEGKY